MAVLSAMEPSGSPCNSIGISLSPFGLNHLATVRDNKKDYHCRAYILKTKPEEPCQEDSDNLSFFIWGPWVSTIEIGFQAAPASCPDWMSIPSSFSSECDYVGSGNEYKSSHSTFLRPDVVIWYSWSHSMVVICGLIQVLFSKECQVLCNTSILVEFWQLTSVSHILYSSTEFPFLFIGLVHILHKTFRVSFGRVMYC